MNFSIFRHLFGFYVLLVTFLLICAVLCPSQGVSGALAVLMKDAIKPTLMQTLEVRRFTQTVALVPTPASAVGEK